MTSPSSLPFLVGAGGRHSWARDVLRQAFYRVHLREPTRFELQAIQALASFDGGYGRGYTSKPELQAAHNWGAVHCCLPDKTTGDCPPGSIKSSDYNAKTGQTYTVCFKAYPDDVAGAADVVRHMTLLRPRAWASFAAGNAVQDWTRELYREHYFGGFRKNDDEGNVTDYADNLWRHLGYIASDTGDPVAFARYAGTPTPSTSKTTIVFPGILMLLAVAWAARRRP